MRSVVKEKILVCFLIFVKFVDCEVYHEIGIGEFTPQISATHVDFKGNVIKILGMEKNSNIFLPNLSAVENAWEGTATVLHCRARFPVQWKYDGPGGPSVKAETFRESRELWNVKNYNFTAQLTFSHSNSNQVGLYTCESISAPEFLKSSFYAYLEQEDGFVHKEDVEVEMSPLSSIMLPCIVTNPKLTPTLYKKLPNGEYKEIPLSKEVKFNPKIGFYSNGNLMNDHYGHYKCKVKNSYRESQLNIFIKKNEIVLSQHDHHKDLKFEIKEGKIYCCSSSGKAPRLKFDSCNCRTWCSILETHLDRKKFYEESSTIGSCAVYEPDELVDDSGLLQCSDSFDEKKKTKILVACDEGICTRAPGNEGTSLKVSLQPSRGTLRASCSYDTFRFAHGVKWTVDDKLVESKGRDFIDLEMRENLGRKITCYAPIWDSPTEWKAATVHI